MTRIVTRRYGKMDRRLRDFSIGDSRGAVGVEFALISPVFLLMLFGFMQGAIVYNNFVELVGGVESGSRQLALGRSTTTPYTSTTSAVTTAAANLTAASITITTKVNGTACASDSACTTALSNASGDAATVLATYPCTFDIIGINFAPSCTLTAQTAELIE